MTKEEIFAFYRDVIGIKSEKTAKQLAEGTRLMHRRKGYHLRNAGDKMRSIPFQLNGVSRCYIIDDEGRESVMGFYYEPGFPCIGGTGIRDKVLLNVDAVTEMDVLELSISTLRRTMSFDPAVTEAIIRFMIEDRNKDYRWQIAMKTKFGEELYLWFLEEYADIVEVVTQKDIASFLGLKPQSLSRIKRSIEQKENSH